MLTFKLLNEENAEKIISEIESEIEMCDVEYLREILDSLLSDDECEYALSYAHSCLLIRVFDGVYSFLYPVALNDEGDEGGCIELLRLYAIKEEIPLIISEVPADCIGEVASRFRHLNMDAQDPERGSYNIKILSEASLLSEVPTFELDGVLLRPLTASDDALYSKLCRSGEINKYWGYDYSLDEPNPIDSYFRESCEGEFSRGVAMSMAIEYEGEFSGEVILYAFDLIGGCQCAIRLLEDKRGRGIAKRAVDALKNIASSMGIVRLYAKVDKENLSSISLFKNSFSEMTDEGKNVVFREEM